MNVKDYSETKSMRNHKSVLDHVRSYREGDDGAFEISHKANEPILVLLIHKSQAYMHYFPFADYLKHAGYRAVNRVNTKVPQKVIFRTIADGPLEVESHSTIQLKDAFVALKEFCLSESLPASIQWEEL